MIKKREYLAVDPMSYFAWYDGTYLGSMKSSKEKPASSFNNAIHDLMVSPHQYKAIIMEMTYFSYKSSNQILLGQRYILKMWAETYNIPLIEYSPKEIKKSFTGSALADKEAMIKECERRGIKVKNDHEADAVAIYYHHLGVIGE